jgi:hypothetical protein
MVYFLHLLVMAIRANIPVLPVYPTADQGVNFYLAFVTEIGFMVEFIGYHLSSLPS